MDLSQHHKAISEIVTIARGESNVEHFLNEITEKWGKTLFEVIDSKGKKCPLVKNWMELREQVGEALTNVMQMKQSPFYKSFERDGAVWEEKLNAAQAIFDVMTDVQRRWVYLQGVFQNSVDVQKTLGYMFQKFKGFDREFVQLMRGIKQDPFVDHWITPEKNLLHMLETNQSTLNTIQKALNEYLESQRAAFSRFYFIGDEDLLEIIGSAKDPKAMNRHWSKMFAGISQVELQPENDSIIVGMSSREGEQVLFKHPIDVTKTERIQDWLMQVEQQMRLTLASLLEEALFTHASPQQVKSYFEWIAKYPAQVVLLATQVRWSERVESVLQSKSKSSDKNEENEEKDSNVNMCKLLEEIVSTLGLLANCVLQGTLESKMRKLYEQLITELVYQRDVTRTLIKDHVCSTSDFQWLSRMRFYWNRFEKDVLKKLEIRISRAKFFYGFEYFGANERLVQTPLTDKAYFTLCEALHSKLGGNPFGPAGTGKTESVKALGTQLGRFVLVFCCDETFDYNAMSRIFVGLCQCGAWGCFDEFNRLEEQILSAVSQQILTIQTGLRENAGEIELNTSRGLEKVRLNHDMGIFVTMNPGYAGRSELPDNLKQLFRGIAMMQPNRVLIAQVIDQLSKQSHYDFGLRALKAVLRSAGNLKRREQMELTIVGNGHELTRMSPEMEQGILIRSLMSTVVPKLVLQDKLLFDSLLASAFPGANIEGIKEEELKTKIKDVAEERHYRIDDQWITKLLQLHTIQHINWGVMLVGPSGTGKTSSRDVLMEAMRLEIDPKSITKEQLFGVLDPTTLEWTDGVFTATLRMIIDNAHGEANKRHWIVFDGDVDPEWAENLNSVLDDNKMLTLPNGERLALTDNVRILFETANLNAATPATVSRCGMVWFSEECVTLPMLFHNQLESLRAKPTLTTSGGDMARTLLDWQRVHHIVVDYLTPLFKNEVSFVYEAMRWVQRKPHVMEFTELRAVWSLFSQLRGGIRNVLEYNETNEVSPLSDLQIRSYMGKYLLHSILWAFGGSMTLDLRMEFGNVLCHMVRNSDNNDHDYDGVNNGIDIGLPDTNSDLSLIDYEVNVERQEWTAWKDQVVNEELAPQRIKDANVVINTTDTLRHSRVIGSWLQERRPVILCGPPGSGKSMTLTAVLSSNPQYEMVTLNFSSTADPSLLFKCFEQHCKVLRTSQGYTLRPIIPNKTLVVFCDECNLPAEDKYGTQTIITFLRQLIEKGGYWNHANRNWVQLENIQIVGACNPPTDAGRIVLSPRFLNHCPLVLIDFPGRESLLEIYGTFVRALLKLTPSLKGLDENITHAMVDVYQKSQQHFNVDIQPHYVYSPRELSRWVRGIDRLVTTEEKDWTWKLIREVADTHLHAVDDLDQALVQPILFSDYLSCQRNYLSVGKAELYEYVVQRVKAFNEEELDVALVIYDELLDHILRIDRVLRQPLGHLLLVGASGAGKSVFSRFVSWLNGMSTFQIKVHKDYTQEHFDQDLRSVLIRAGVDGERITFLFDESNILHSAFLERMNALLASGEVPGLFEEAELQQLLAKLREAARKEEELKETEEELYQWFTRRVQHNLHI
ncbi:dynein heavy chain, partial [Reticulomyxa filosa]